MSNRVSQRALRTAAALAGITVVASVLAGCSTFGSSAFRDPVTTGSTSASGEANTSQAMPRSLAQASGNSQPQAMQVASGEYVPPRDIGQSSSANPQVSGSAASQGTSPQVVSQDLPSLNSPSAEGTNQTMPAQLSTQTQTASAPQPVPAQQASAEPERDLTMVQRDGYTHVIESGESLYSIARKYGVTTDSIVQANGLNSPDQILVGQKLTIPGATAPKKQTTSVQTASAAPAPASEKPEPAPAAPAQQASQADQTAPASDAGQQPTQVASVEATSTPARPEPQATSSDGFRWPVTGKVIADFQASKGTGINIEVPEGTTVRAAGAGSVIYVGNAVEGYGNLVLIKHDNGYVSAYAHLGAVNVSKGQTVSRGAAIGSAGMTGSVTRPQLHFELRKGATPVDPQPLLAG